MNSGPEILSDESTTLPSGTEVEMKIVRHWGCKLPSGITIWDPGYGSGVYVPFDEAEARSAVERSGPGAKLVSRTETTVVTTSPWEEVTDG